MQCLLCSRPRSGRKRYCSAHSVEIWIRRPLTADGILDEIAIERGMKGHRVRLTSAEKAEVVRRLTAKGLSAAEIGDRLHMSGRHVVRYRQRITVMAEAS